MSKKILALIIFVVAVVGVYGLFYAAVTTVLIPNDFNSFKAELEAMPQIPVINDSVITEAENAAADMENYSPLSAMSQDQRIVMANEMRNSNNVPPEVLNQDFSAYANVNNNRAVVYAMILKGDLSNDIRNLSSRYEEISNLGNEMVSLSQEMATDFENGDDKAYADDLRKSADLMKEYNNKMAELKIQLQDIVNQLS